METLQSVQAEINDLYRQERALYDSYCETDGYGVIERLAAFDRLHNRKVELWARKRQLLAEQNADVVQ